MDVCLSHKKVESSYVTTLQTPEMSDNANMSDNSNISDDSEGEIVSKHHSKLLKAVEKLDKGQRYN